MIHFNCPSCGMAVSAPEDCAGRTMKCRRCNGPIVIPHIVTVRTSLEPAIRRAMPAPSLRTHPSVETPLGEDATEPTITVKKAAPFIASTLALAILGFAGWLMWLFQNPLSQPSRGLRSEDREQLASLAQVTLLPLVQEVESSRRDISAPLPRQIPPSPVPPLASKKRSSEPPPLMENQPLDLPLPARLTEDTTKKKPPLSYADKGEAYSLGEELIKATAEQQDSLLEKLRLGKGPEYTQALAAAIGQLSDEVKKKARQTLADRLTRFTAKTLLAYLGDENPELRCAAALALGMKDDKDHIGELMAMLEDPEPLVVRAVQASLKSLTSQDAVAKEDTKARTARTSEPRAHASSGPKVTPPPADDMKPPATSSQASKAKQKKNDDDLPDVSLVPPEETSSAVQAIIKANAIALHSNRPSQRIQAAQVLGGLGEAGKPARRLLCAAMLDPVIAVRVAAADALKNIDPKMHYLAVVLSTEKVATGNDATRVVTLLEKIQKLEEDGEPLAPLVAYVARFAANSGGYNLFTTALTTLTHIGRRDLSSYRVVAVTLTSRDALIRSIALRGLARMKHGKLAVPRILVLLKHDTPANRIAAIEALATLADESTEEIIVDAIATQRYHGDEEVRRAVEVALNKLENKQNP